MITHDPEDVDAFAEDLAVYADGRILAMERNFHTRSLFAQDSLSYLSDILTRGGQADDAPSASTTCEPLRGTHCSFRPQALSAQVPTRRGRSRAAAPASACRGRRQAPLAASPPLEEAKSRPIRRRDGSTASSGTNGICTASLNHFPGMRRLSAGRCNRGLSAAPGTTTCSRTFTNVRRSQVAETRARNAGQRRFALPGRRSALFSGALFAECSTLPD